MNMHAMYCLMLPKKSNTYPLCYLLKLKEKTNNILFKHFKKNRQQTNTNFQFSNATEQNEKKK